MGMVFSWSCRVWPQAHERQDDEHFLSSAGIINMTPPDTKPDMYTSQQLLDLQHTLYASSNPTRRWLHCSRRDWILEQINTTGKGVLRALEVGPGSGIYLPALAAVANQLVAADIEAAYLEQAQGFRETLGNLECILDDITNTGLEPASFDLILCTEVIEHIPDVPAALAGLEHLLAPGGKLILSTPQKYSPLELCARIAFLPGVIQLVRMVYREPIIETGHISLQTEKQLRRALDGAGLRVESTHKSGFYLPLVAEFMGETGRKCLAWCESRLRGSFASGLLWTQYWVLGK
jgi:2-polyprenyl-3-methyl-5-hydroxy-6-metoxy-1,4-benzoquinol methylase